MNIDLSSQFLYPVNNNLQQYERDVDESNNYY